MSLKKFSGNKNYIRDQHVSRVFQDFCVLGVDTLPGSDNHRLGLVFKVKWGTQISLDGDGGFR